MDIHLRYGDIFNSEDPYLKKKADFVNRFDKAEPTTLVELDLGKVPPETYPKILEIAESEEDSRLKRTIKAMMKTAEGDQAVPIPNFDAALAMFTRRLKVNPINGWLFKEGRDGKLYPYLMVGIREKIPYRNEEGKPQIIIELLSYTASSDSRRAEKTSISFEPADMTRKTVEGALLDYGYLIETPDLHADYEAQMAKYRKIEPLFAQQLVFTGNVYQDADRWGRSTSDIDGDRKVIHDSPVKEDRALPAGAPSFIVDEEDLPVPAHPLIRCFDLGEHTFYWVHTDFCEVYQYRADLSDKLVLPESHRDLLNVLTTNLDAFLGDIIEGKSAGNIVLTKGPPGVGKTLTAEIYSEIIQKPLYKIHTGSLGTTASQIEKSLKTIFERYRRWKCVLLLDEADVFVKERGDNIEQNAIVAEFLRVLEYFEGLMFMTTNRPNDIDEAIVSRCAAIIDYKLPAPALRRAIWNVMFTNFDVKMDKKEELIDELVEHFPTIAGRDIKMLLRLVLRVSLTHNEPLTLDLFKRVAMFRAIDFEGKEELDG